MRAAGQEKSDPIDPAARHAATIQRKLARLLIPVNYARAGRFWQDPAQSDGNMCGMHFHGSRFGRDVDSDEAQEGREQAFFGFVQKMAGIVMICLAIWLFTGRRGLPRLAFADIICEAVPIGLLFGRIANFINGELFGRVTDVPWAMAFPGGGPMQGLGDPPPPRRGGGGWSVGRGLGLRTPR